MSFSTCPAYSASLLRIGLRGLSAKIAKPETSLPSRWLAANPTNRCSAAILTSRMLSTTPDRRPAPRARVLPIAHRRTFFGPKIIRNYEDLPRDYRDQVGLSFGSKELTEVEVMKLFGAGLDVVKANHLLRILHGRRVAGTLQDPAFAVHTAQYSNHQIEVALEYLRKTAPVEETLNAGLRAEDELDQIEKEEAEKKSKKHTVHGNYKVIMPDPVYGHSKLDEIRARNIALRKIQEEEAEAAKLHAAELAEMEAKGESPTKALEAIDHFGKAITNAKVAKYYKSSQSDMKEPPAMATWQRILPSAVTVLLAVGFLSAVAMVYEEPAARYRLFPDITTSQATIGSIILLNALVYLGWRFPPLWKAWNNSMILIVATVKPYTLFTSSFSHQQLGHLVTNMVCLWFIGTSLHDEVGRANFLALYLASGSLGFLGTLTAYASRGMLAVTSLGASGATLGVWGAYLWLHRDDGFRFWGLPEGGVHGIVFLALLYAMQLTLLGKAAKLDVASHLTGLTTGVVGMELIKRFGSAGQWAANERPKRVTDTLPWSAPQRSMAAQEQQHVMRRVVAKE